MIRINVFRKVIIALLFVAAATGFSCSTKKNTFTRRAYHNLTAHYNAYFNGNESLKEGAADLAKKNIDNYIKVLPVFELGKKEDAQTVYPQMDRAIEKGSIVIQRHSIYIKRVEHVKWIDDAYMLIGKAYYYKQEYDLALMTFSFIMDRFKHNSIYYEAVIWKARTYNEQGKFNDADALLSSIANKIAGDKGSRNAEKMFPLVYADLFIKQEQYGNAIEYLQQGLKLNRTKKIRTRLTFILAQVYQRTGNGSKAAEYYRKVLDMNPPYEMTFAAKINLAKSYDVTQGDSRTIKKLLTRMIRDSKNKDFLDQIYYALAEIALKENDETAAIKYLKLSAQSSISNNYQKAISYLALADLYYEKPQYRPAQIFYDSCMQVLPKDFPTYTIVEGRKNTLTDLIKNINILELEDSLQALGRMTDGERRAKVNEIINNIIKQEEIKRQEEADRQQALYSLQQMNQGNQNPGGSQWYFYNPSAMSFGYTEFIKKWGNRKFEDLWRLSNKTVVDFDFNNDENDADSLSGDSVVKANNPKDPNTYLKQIPLTPEAIAISNERIKEAMYNIGYIYKDGLSDYDRAIEAYEAFLKRFEECKFTLPAYYDLYRIYEEKEDAVKMDHYKQLILSKYPGSDYAKIISDPDYYKKLQAEKDKVSTMYKSTWLLYEQGQYETVIRNADSAISVYKDKVVIPKFEYLKALAIGKSKEKAQFIAALQNVVSKYPKSEVAPHAQNILDFLLGKKEPDAIQKGVPQVKDSVANNPVLPEIYKFDPSGFHFYIVVMEARTIKINEIKNIYSDHNTKYYSTAKLTVNSLFLDDKHEVLNVGRFDNKDKGMDYITSVMNDQGLIARISVGNYRHFVISANNYAAFYKSKDVDKYLEFYNKNYQKK